MKETLCKHSFRQGLEAGCALGLNPDAMAKEACLPGEDYKLGLIFRLPCSSREGDIAFRSRNGILSPERMHLIDQKPVCACFCEPTEEELRADEADRMKFSHDCTTARGAIVTHIAENGKSNGSLICPICSTGELRYSMAPGNNHIHARCSTADCVAWME